MPAFETLQAIHKTYEISPEARARNTGKKILMAVGASGTGKSRLTNEVIRLRPDIRPIATRTTRNRRPEDPLTFTTANEGFTHEQALELAKKGEFVNFSPFGTHIYGTTPEDFTDFSMGPITADSVPRILDGGFANAAVIYPLVGAATFREVLEAERMNFKDIAYRLNEGIDSTEFALMSVDRPWFHAVENSHEPGGLQQTAEHIIAIGEGETVGLDTRIARRTLIAMRNVLLDLKETL